MSENKRWPDGFFWFLASAIMLFLFLAIYMKGCGIQPAKKTVVEREPIPVADNPVCEGAGGNPSRTLPCKKGEDGLIVEVCDEAGKWKVAANSCKAIPGPDEPKPEIKYDLDYLETTELAHLPKVLDEDDRLNTVFVSLIHAKLLDLDMKAQYDALNRTLNSVSFEQKLTRCEPIDAVGSVCAFDGRDLGLNEAEVGLITEKLNRPFQSKTTKGLIISQLIGRAVSTIHYDDLIATLLGDADLYNKLMNFQDAVQVYSLFGINIAKQVQDKDYYCIGTLESGISASQSHRLMCGFEGNINGRDTLCWLTFDNNGIDSADQNLLLSPFIDVNASQKIYKFLASESICTLPSGQMSYILANAGGTLVGEAPTDIVTCNAGAACLDGIIDTPSDCLGCHQDGFIRSTDQILPHILKGGFEAGEVELAKAIYLDPTDSEAIFTEQNEEYAKSLDGLGIKFGDRNHLIEVFNSFFRLQSRAQVAAYLMITEKDLEDCINSSDLVSQQIGVLLTSGKVDQDSFSTAFNDILNECKINVDPLVRPL